MSPPPFPFAVRLIGFSADDVLRFNALFSTQKGKASRYFVLGEGNLQDPDLYICRAADMHALVQLSHLSPSEVRPALLVGSPPMALPYAQVRDPIDWHELTKALDTLLGKRADALAQLEASDIVLVPERRRRERIDPDCTDPAHYEKMRKPIPEDGIVLVLDRSPVLSDFLSDLLIRHRMRVEYTRDERAAVAMSALNPTALMFVNTSTPGVDPYRVGSAVKEKNAPRRTTVILLVSKPFFYDVSRATQAGLDGYLNKPLASHHLVSTLKKFIPRLY
jgi:CheY-like chemotaxis protein